MHAYHAGCHLTAYLSNHAVPRIQHEGSLIRLYDKMSHVRCVVPMLCLTCCYMLILWLWGNLQGETPIDLAEKGDDLNVAHVLKRTDG